jgi:hypothetical protein
VADPDPPRGHDPFGLYREDDDEAEDQPPGRFGTAARVVTALTLLGLGAATLSFGAAGLLVATSCVVAVTGLVLLLRVPAPPAPRRRRRPSPAVDNAAFRAYREVAEQLSWAAVSPRHYDLVTRPLLVRLAAARLADRHRVDLRTQPEAARALLGADVWPWVDPHREVSRDSQPPGVGRETLTRVVDRLEGL